MQPSPEQSDAERPTGTLALLTCAAALMAIAWLFLYFSVFLPRGILN